jgi:hypothetical protein
MLRNVNLANVAPEICPQLIAGRCNGYDWYRRWLDGKSIIVWYQAGQIARLRITKLINQVQTG